MVESGIEVEFTDRYGGGPGPSLWSVCRGQCEGLGSVPVYRAIGDVRTGDDIAAPELTDLALIAAWVRAEAESPSEDGWHFVRCPECGGSGKTRGFVPRARQFVWCLGQKARFARSHVFVRPYGSGTAALALMWQKDQASRIVEQTEAEVVRRLATFDASSPEGDCEVPSCPFAVGYGDRLDVPHPWWFNRKLSLRVLFGRIK